MRKKHRKDKKGQRRKSFTKPSKGFLKKYRRAFRQRVKNAIRKEDVILPVKERDGTWDWN